MGYCIWRVRSPLGTSQTLMTIDLPIAFLCNFAHMGEFYGLVHDAVLTSPFRYTISFGVYQGKISYFQKELLCQGCNYSKIFMVEFILRTNLRQQLRASRSSGTRVSPFICFQLDRQRECLSFRDLWLDKWAAL